MTTTNNLHLPFSGFPPAAFAFYEALAWENTKTFWSAHAEQYQQSVRGPMAALLADLEPEFGAGKVFRPNRDVRFSSDKSPYKDHQGGYVQTSSTCGFYVQVDRDTLMVGGGWYTSTPDQVAHYRASVLASPGAELAQLTAHLSAKGYQIGGQLLKSRPRGVPADHPRVDLLRHRSLTVQRDFPGDEPWVATAAAADQVRTCWNEIRGLLTWLAQHATDPPGAAPAAQLAP